MPNILLILWALLVLGSLLLTEMLPAAADPATRGWQRVTVFLIWQATALLIAIVAAVFAFRARQPGGSARWWIGWGPVLGSFGIAAFVALAALALRLF